LARLPQSSQGLVVEEVGNLLLQLLCHGTQSSGEQVRVGQDDLLHVEVTAGKHPFCFCPSCHQKRMLIYGEWVDEEILAPVPHRQYLFIVPRVLRGAFHQLHRLGEFCRIVRRLLTEAYREADPDGQPCFILFLQTFGDLVTFHPHIHALVTDDVFDPNGVFWVLPPIPSDLLEQQLRRGGVEMLLADEAIDEDLLAKLLRWQHSGFSVDDQTRIEATEV